MSWKAIGEHPAYLYARYIVVNTIFAACLYYGFFEQVEGAKNVALFMAWITGLLGVLIMFGLFIDDLDNNDNKGDLRETFARMPQSVIPFPIDLAFDLALTCTFIWFGHYILALFYIVSIYAGKAVRDVPKNMILNKLKSQQS